MSKFKLKLRSHFWGSDMSSSKSNKNPNSSRTNSQNIKGKAGKIRTLEHLTDTISLRTTDAELYDYAQQLIDPRGCKPVVMPTPAPVRAGVAKFPLVVEVTTPTAFGITVQPGFKEPLCIYSGVAAAESGGTWRGSATMSMDRLAPIQNLGVDSLDASAYVVNSTMVDGEVALPLISNVGATMTFNLTNAGSSGSSNYEVEIWGYDGSSWSLRGTSLKLPTVGSTSGVAVIWAPIDTHFTFKPKVASIALMKLQFAIEPVGAGTATMAPLGDPGAALIHKPDWAALLSVSKRAQIVAVDCLVTFEGSNLENGGSIAVCNSDDDLVIQGSFYETIASQPFDMYRGRLASAGETEGGAHWHYVPDSVDAFTMRDASEVVAVPQQRPKGYFGVIGKAANQPVRIECHFIVNFFSSDPSYCMELTPCFAQYPRFLWSVRDLVPLVSSNDSHLKKIAKLGKGFGKKAIAAKNFAVNHDKEIAKALSLIATML